VEYADPAAKERERDTLFPGWQDAEIDRQKMIGLLGGDVQRAGWLRVLNQDDAAFILSATGQRMQGSGNNIAVSLALLPTMKTNHHAYVASLSDPNFPLPTEGFGSAHMIVIYGSYTDRELFRHLDLLLQASQIRSLRTAAALCETRAKLTEEGTSLEELRGELVREIEQVRERHRQEKRLQVDVE
jgi:hypothetical protein